MERSVKKTKTYEDAIAAIEYATFSAIFQANQTVKFFGHDTFNNADGDHDERKQLNKIRKEFGLEQIKLSPAPKGRVVIERLCEDPEFAHFIN